MRTHGELVRLRPVEADDLEAIVEALTHPELWGVGIPGEESGPVPRSRQARRADVESWPAPDDGEAWIVEVEGEMVGWARVDWGWDAISPSIGVAVTPGRRRRGFGRDAALLLLHHCFSDTPAHTVHAWVVESNEAGRRFAEALGFRPAGRVRRVGILDGRYVDAIPFDLLRSEWADEARS